MARQNVVVSQEGTPKNDAIEVQGPADVTAPPRAFQDPQGIQRRLFQAMSFTAEGHYLFLCDIESNWSRWSHNAVVDFGLPGDMMYDAGSIWIEHIHPSDREAWSNDIDQVFFWREEGPPSHVSREKRVGALCDGRLPRRRDGGRFRRAAHICGNHRESQHDSGK